MHSRYNAVTDALLSRVMAVYRRLGVGRRALGDSLFPSLLPTEAYKKGSGG